MFDTQVPGYCSGLRTPFQLFYNLKIYDIIATYISDWYISNQINVID